MDEKKDTVKGRVFLNMTFCCHVCCYNGGDGGGGSGGGGGCGGDGRLQFEEISLKLDYRSNRYQY